MRPLVITLILVALTGCGKSEAEVLEANYEKWDHASFPSQCREAQAVAAAWAREGDQDKYDEWKLTADTECLLAKARGF